MTSFILDIRSFTNRVSPCVTKELGERKTTSGKFMFSIINDKDLEFLRTDLIRKKYAVFGSCQRRDGGLTMAMMMIRQHV